MKLLYKSFLLLAAFFLCGTSASAQWAKSTGYNSANIIQGFLGYSNYLLGDAHISGIAPPTIDSLYASIDNGQTWVPFAPHGGVPLTAVLVGVTPNLIGTASYSIPGGLQGILSYSSDFGKTWSPDTLGYPTSNSTNDLAGSLVSIGTTIYASDGSFGIYQQTSPGARWTPDTVGMNVGGTVYNVSSLIVFGNNIFAGAFGGGVLVSTNMGASWSQGNNGIPPIQAGFSPGIAAFAISGTSLFAMIPHNGFIDTLYDFYRTTNNGQNWTLMNPTSINSSGGSISFTATSQNLFVATDSGVYVSKNNGTTWTLSNQGFPAFEVSTGGSYINTIAVSGGDLVIGRGILGEIWYRKLSDFANSSVGATDGAASFTLSKSFPNPVNSTSKINYSLSNNGIASLTLFDIAGKQIEVLANGYQIAGNHTTTFDGSALPSGMYFYRLTTPDGSIGHWLQLIK